MISQQVESGTLSPFYERFAYSPVMGDETLPEDFNFSQWADQSSRYEQYNHWFSGDALADTRSTESGDLESQYPLHMNILRGLVRKHAAVLFGEVPDGPAPLVKTVVRPKKRFDGGDVPESTKKLASMLESIINEVWTKSGGRAMQLENGKFSQYMGGSVFQISYRPQRKDLIIPLVISNPRPDHYLPEWSNDDYWSLLRGTTVYTFSALTAKLQYNIGDGEPTNPAVYMQSETAKSTTVTVDGTPIQFMGKEMNGVPNGFGFVPAVYIPHQLEGMKYGTSHVEDVAAIIKEYNARVSDLGTAVLNTVDPETFLSNVTGNPTVSTSPVTGRKFTNLGTTPPASGSKDAPKAYKVDAPPVAPTMVTIADIMYRQFLRDSDMTGITNGEDEGSQRSGATLALRMWPILSHTRGERTHWNDGLTRLGWYIIKMVKQIMTENEFAGKTMKDAGISIPDDYEQLVDISTEWSPQIPQDREKMVQEFNVLAPNKVQSKRLMIERLGDAKDVDAELELLKQDAKSEAKLAAQSKPPPFGGNTNGSGAPKTTIPATPASSAN